MRMNRLVTAFLAGAALTAPMLAAPAFAQERPHHVRGTLESVQGNDLTVKTAGGATDAVKTDDKTKVFQVSPGQMSDIKDGKFVGITSVEKGGKRVAVEVHVFDDKLRGLAEGHYPWDLGSEPNMMTNANIAQVESGVGGETLKLDYKDGTQMITVPDSATVVDFTEATPDQLKPGAQVFVVARKENGGDVAIAVVVGNGVKPPM
ncbi:MAG: hypothetical protein JO047_08015 [Alphaproteobacteria bacterium]|nr:hypothetical protein [Alphaproteobacteria bacterium]